MSSGLANSLAANVEATLTFSLASRLVDMLLALQMSSSSSSASSYSIAWMLAAMCLMILSFTSSASKALQGDTATSAAQDLISMLNQTLVLAFSRVVMMQARYRNMQESRCK